MNKLQIDLGFNPIKVIGSEPQQVVMPVLHVQADRVSLLGSSFSISNSGYMMTAAHIFSDFFPNQLIHKNDTPVSDPNLYVLYVKNLDPDDNTKDLFGGLLPIKYIWLNDFTDIAYFWVQLPLMTDTKEPLSLYSLKMTTSMPNMGENILGFGYYEGSGVISDNPSILNNKIMEYGHQSASSTGKVVDVHFEKRDNVRLKFPCFQVDARFDAGMSGGPLMRENGMVCGVICSSTVEERNDEGYVSYGASIWPSLGQIIELPQPDTDEKLKIHALELANRKVFGFDETLGLISIKANGDGTTTVSQKVVQ